MIRKAIIVLLLVSGLAVVGLWAVSYYEYDRRKHPPSRLHTVTRFTNERRTCHYVTSLHGWLRFGVVRIDKPFGPLPDLDDRDTWIWLGSLLWPEPRGVELLGANNPLSAHLGGLVVIGGYKLGVSELDGVAVRHWPIALLLLTYPAITLIWRPIGRRKRRQRGACVSCGYDLTGNVTGVCSECGAKVVEP